MYFFCIHSSLVMMKDITDSIKPYIFCSLGDSSNRSSLEAVGTVRKQITSQHGLVAITMPKNQQQRSGS
uniref:Uncharacterized protein n=1 Tax=Oryza rufipogon TaxID=4529 RepID=A0A0E0QZ97_ORYRU